MWGFGGMNNQGIGSKGGNSMEIFVGLVMLGAIIAVAYYAFVSEFHTSQTIQSPNLSSQSFTQNEPTPEAVEHFDRAVDMLQ